MIKVVKDICVNDLKTLSNLQVKYSICVTDYQQKSHESFENNKIRPIQRIDKVNVNLI